MLDCQDYLKQFQAIAKKNNWQHLHTPKNLAMAVLQESAELCAEFQWLTDQQANSLSQDKIKSVGGEIADVAMYLFALCDALGLDLDQLIVEKQAVNETRFGLI